MKRSELAASLQQILIVLEKKCSACKVADELEYLCGEVYCSWADKIDGKDADDWLEEE